MNLIELFSRLLCVNIIEQVCANRSFSFISPLLLTAERAAQVRNFAHEPLRELLAAEVLAAVVGPENVLDAFQLTLVRRHTLQRATAFRHQQIVGTASPRQDALYLRAVIRMRYT